MFALLLLFGTEGLKTGKSEFGAASRREGGSRFEHLFEILNLSGGINFSSKQESKEPDEK